MRKSGTHPDQSIPKIEWPVERKWRNKRKEKVRALFKVNLQQAPKRAKEADKIREKCKREGIPKA